MYTVSQAFVLCVIVACSYVAVIHVNLPENIKGKERNNPDVIKYRFYRITALCCGLVIALPLLLKYIGAYSDARSVIYALGLVPGMTLSGSFAVDMSSIFHSVKLIVMLYMGPILDYPWEIQFSGSAMIQDFHDSFNLIWGIRDHIFAPITEELIYRSVILALLQPLDEVTDRQKILLTPLFFGIAHAHHGYDLYTNKNVDLSTVLLTVTAQVIYTTLFGVLSNYLFLESSNNLWCPIIVHCICNLIGFPEFPEDRPLFWKITYYILLVAGIGAFVKLL